MRNTHTFLEAGKKAGRRVGSRAEKEEHWPCKEGCKFKKHSHLPCRTAQKLEASGTTAGGGEEKLK